MLHIFKFQLLKENKCYHNFMNTLFDDEFINKRVFSRLVKEIKREQLDKTIEEINYLNELQNHILTKNDFEKEQSVELDFIKKLNNAKRTNIQA